MTFRPLSTSAGALLALSLLSGCVHTPPGTSVKVAKARKAELIRLPAPPAPVQPPQVAGAPQSSAPVASYTPEKSERVADAFSRGEFCLGAGKDQEAIAAFQEAVRIDPHFADAWVKLASLYEKTGQEKQAIEAYKKSKAEGATGPALTAM